MMMVVKDSWLDFFICPYLKSKSWQVNPEINLKSNSIKVKSLRIPDEDNNSMRKWMPQKL